MPRIAHGTRDHTGTWHAENPDEYPPLDVHGILPWSVLQMGSKPWQERKKHWKNLGVDTPAPRAGKGAMIATGRHGNTSGGVSLFDPVLTELMVTWHTRTGDTVIDPFAGGAVRGIITETLGRHYYGTDLNPEQVNANQDLAATHGLAPAWDTAPAQQWEPPTADYLLTCPPYHNLERYTQHPQDLSTMRWGTFLEEYEAALTPAVRALNEDRFVTVIIGDVRDHRGHLRGLPDHTTRILTGLGLHLVNHQILVAPLGLAAKRMRIPWTAARTTTRIHQHALTLVKGDRRAATRRLSC